MRLFLVKARLGGRRRIPKSLAVFLVSAGLFLSQMPRVAAQSSPSQSLAVNRALVSSGPPALPPTAPALRPPLPEVTTEIQLDPPPAPPLYLTGQRGFPLVGVRAGQLVQIAVQYPAVKTGRLIKTQALDGGQLLVEGPLLVGLDGFIRFQFRAASTPGVNHISLRDGVQELGLAFWVLDEERPERNPPVINSGN